MVIANDGLWQPPSFLHGAVSWMQHYLGWRGWYGSEAFGWHDRVRTAILAFAALQINQVIVAERFPRCWKSRMPFSTT